MSNFLVRIDEGEQRKLSVKTGNYTQAAAAVPAIFEIDLPCYVEIWCKKLIPKYGPYFYRIEYDAYQNVICRQVFKR